MVSSGEERKKDQEGKNCQDCMIKLYLKTKRKSGQDFTKQILSHVQFTKKDQHF